MIPILLDSLPLDARHLAKGYGPPYSRGPRSSSKLNLFFWPAYYAQTKRDDLFYDPQEKSFFF